MSFQNYTGKIIDDLNLVEFILHADDSLFSDEQIMDIRDDPLEVRVGYYGGVFEETRETLTVFLAEDDHYLKLDPALSDFIQGDELALMSEICLVSQIDLVKRKNLETGQDDEYFSLEDSLFEFMSLKSLGRPPETEEEIDQVLRYYDTLSQEDIQEMFSMICNGEDENMRVVSFLLVDDSPIFYSEILESGLVAIVQ